MPGIWGAVLVLWYLTVLHTHFFLVKCAASEEPRSHMRDMHTMLGDRRKP